MINGIDPNYIQMEITAVLTIAFFGFLLWVNRDKNNEFEEKAIKLFAFLCAVLVVGVFVYGIGYFIYRIVGG